VLVNAGWIALGVGVAVTIVVIATSWLRRRDDSDFGTVSHQWITEQRFGPRHDRM
jgi:hypothetical protein